MTLAQHAAGVEWKDRPERGIKASLKHPGITITPGEKLRVDLMVKITGKQDEMVLAEVLESPPGWDAAIRYLGNAITGMYVAAADYTSFELVAAPKDKKKADPGTYKFVVQVMAQDGEFKQTSAIEVTVIAEEEADQELEVTTSYPVLRGPTSSTFEFSLELRNNNSKDQLFNLAAQAPQGWDVSFKPAYENKQISSAKIKGDSSSTLGVVVTPPNNAEAGDYPIKISVKGDKASAETQFLVQLTGTHKIKALTPDGLLSFATQVGEPATVSFYVRNEGSAPQPEISFVTFKPENWKVEFKPEKLTGLKPGEFKQVEATITPAQNALVGDYSVALNAKGEQADSTMEFRVTVKASSTWGWVGIGIIVLALFGLGFAFIKFGRR
jgi:uncharacterized membrane protein